MSFLQPESPSSLIVTADIGGSHVTAALCNLTNHALIRDSIVRYTVNCHGSASEILETWGNAIKASVAQTQSPVSGIAIAMPGPFDYEHGISYIDGLDKYEALYGIDIKEFLANRFRLDPSLIKFRNDAASTIAGEVLAGAGKSFKTAMGVTLGTGFGSAYSDHNLTEDINLGSATYLDSIADDYFSTRWFLKRFEELTGRKVTGVKELLLQDGDPNVIKALFDEFAQNLVEFLSPYIHQYNPEVFILCGNIANAASLFVPHLISAFESITFQVGKLGEEAAMIGACELFLPLYQAGSISTGSTKSNS